MDPAVGKKRVVIIGGGVAGAVAAYNLQDVADVYFIDPKEYFEMIWASLRCMVEPSLAQRSVINHSEYAPSAHIITSAAVNITATEVTTAQGRVLAYDYLIIAIGTGHDDTTPFSKSEKISSYQSDQAKIKAANGILVVGGGPTGVELAAEISVDFPDKKVILVHRGSRLLEFIGEKAGKKALDWLTKKNVEVILGQTVNLDSGSNGVYQTSGGESIVADCHFLCTGKQPLASSWLKDTIVGDCLDNKGKLKVDAEMRVKGHNNIFAIGDITDVNELKQATPALMHAEAITKSIKSLISGKDKLTPYKGGSQLEVVTLGRREAVAQISCLTMVGRIPSLMIGDLGVSKTRQTLGLKD